MLSGLFAHSRIKYYCLITWAKRPTYIATANNFRRDLGGVLTYKVREWWILCAEPVQKHELLVKHYIVWTPTYEILDWWGSCSPTVQVARTQPTYWNACGAKNKQTNKQKQAQKACEMNSLSSTSCGSV